MAVLPMFPLGTVLLPGALLPLHVFEPRYRALVRDCLADEEPEFGVVLIARGREVGGGDVRHEVGTVARMLRVQDLGGGERYSVLAVGARRLRVNAWLPDDPYPLADVDDWPDGGEAATAAVISTYEQVVQRVRRVMAAAVELGDTNLDPGMAFSDDPREGAYQLAIVAPIGPADRYELLCSDGTGARLAALDAQLDAVAAAQDFRMRS